MSITLSDITAGSTHLSGNEIRVKASTSGVLAGATEYKILLKITSMDGVLIGAPFIDAIAPDENGEAEFNISGYVDQGMERQIIWPVPERYAGRIKGWQNMSYTIALYPGESYVDSEGEYQEEFFAGIQPVFVVNGRLHDYYLARLNALETNWFDYYCTAGRFFSFMPLEQEITPFQPVRLSWIPPINMQTEMKVRYRIGEQTETVVVFSGTLYYDILNEFDLHPENVGLPLVDAEGNRLEYFEVWIESEGVQVCETCKFLVNWEPPVEHYWYLFVNNNIGGVDCISLTGAARYEPSGQRTILRRPFRYGNGTQTPTRLVTGSKRQRCWTINSGFKLKAEMEALDILLETQEAWLAIPPENGSTDISQYSLTPVIITNTEMLLHDDMEELESIDIELSEAY